MLKRQVTFTDFDGNQRVQPLYFNLTKFEWLELEQSVPDGFSVMLQAALETEDTNTTVNLLKKLILTAYGERTAEGAFVKTDDKAIQFSKSEQFSALFWELVNDPAASEQFFTGLIPADQLPEIEKKMKELRDEKVLTLVE